ncbi:hypothetical protein J6590_025301 [Homalodisca vitripennis]|nr:hypothetical protein J6590_025301 [Homalodisca vitripennis]
MAALDVPDWLTADFLKSCLESEEEICKSVEIVSHSIERAVSPGNNYGSNMYRVKVRFKTSNSEYSLPLIIKSPLSQSGSFDANGELSREVCTIEQRYYSEFINKTYSLMKHSIVPKHYTSPNPACVVLEDLKVLGYVMTNRHKMLDFDHCQLYIKASAKLHALSMVLYEKEPEIFETSLKRSQKAAECSKQLTKSMLLGSFRCMAAYVEDKPGCEKYFNILKEVNENELLYKIFDEVNQSHQPLQALTQNDPWCGNMMFKYDSNGKVTHIKIFDFQCVELTSPVKELITFLWVCANQEVRETKVKDLYNLYYESLNANLAELKYSKRMTLEDFNSEIVAWSPLVLYCVCMNVPVCIADHVADINDYLTGDILKKPVKESPVYKLFQGTTFNEFYPLFLHQVDKIGVFDYLSERLKQEKLKMNNT